MVFMNPRFGSQIARFYGLAPEFLTLAGGNKQQRVVAWSYQERVHCNFLPTTSVSVRKLRASKYVVFGFQSVPC